MNDKQMMIEVRGKNKHLDEWRSDGLEVNVVEYAFPYAVAQLGLTRPWMFLQDIFNFRNPWRK